VSLIRPAWVPRPTPVNGPAPTEISETKATGLNGPSLPDERRVQRRTSRDRDVVSTGIPNEPMTLRKTSDTAQDQRMSDVITNVNARRHTDLTASTSTANPAEATAVESAKSEDTSMDDLTRSFDAVLEFVPRGVRKREKRRGGSGMDVGM
jgi:hypothetical protein